jgi:hypothetical protein
MHAAVRPGPGRFRAKAPVSAPHLSSTRSPVVANWLPQSGPLAAPADELVDALFKAEAVKRTSFELGFERGAHPGSASFRRKLDGVTLTQAEHGIPVGHSLRDAARALTSLGAVDGMYAITQHCHVIAGYPSVHAAEPLPTRVAHRGFRVARRPPHRAR